MIGFVKITYMLSCDSPSYCELVSDAHFLIRQQKTQLHLKQKRLFARVIEHVIKVLQRALGVRPLAAPNHNPPWPQHYLRREPVQVMPPRRRCLHSGAYPTRHRNVLAPRVFEKFEPKVLSGTIKRHRHQTKIDE